MAWPKIIRYSFGKWFRPEETSDQTWILQQQRAREAPDPEQAVDVNVRHGRYALQCESTFRNLTETLINALVSWAAIGVFARCVCGFLAWESSEMDVVVLLRTKAFFSKSSNDTEDAVGCASTNFVAHRKPTASDRCCGIRRFIRCFLSYHAETGLEAIADSQYIRVRIGFITFSASWRTRAVRTRWRSMPINQN